ncbi:ABC transporter ATP-binding protein [Leeuwenhoekiella marinoflava]|uniref:ABC transporter ATP-binding protein n=1 Tax=Leeuwenhoekiella marinoflava TaxID=988 RepID=UPI003001E9B1
MSDIILKAENISKQYRLGTVGSGTLRDDFKRSWARLRGKEDPFLKVGALNDRSQKSTEDYVWALCDINFEVKQGEVLGIIGKNGAGKSTLLKILSRVTAPTTGVIKSRGRIASLLEVGTGFHHELTGRENIYLNGAILGMTKAEINSKLDEIIDFSGCERYIDTPTKRYSSGMTVRLAFAVAAHLEPEILVVDEVLAVGDAEFQKKAIGKMQDISQGEGRTVLFVSHNMASVRSLCTRVIVLDNGVSVFNGATSDSLRFYIGGEDHGSSLRNRTDRMGSQYLIFSDIKLLNSSGQETNAFYVNDFLRIRLMFETKKRIQKLIINITITDSEDRLLAAFPSDEFGERFKLKSENIILDVPQLSLRPGKYWLNIISFSNTTHPDNAIDIINRVCSFEVLPIKLNLELRSLRYMDAAFIQGSYT